MKWPRKHKGILVEVICYLFILLFVYAAVSKLLDFENFRVQLGQSPLLTAFAGWVAWAVPVVEILVAGMLFFPRLRLWALYAAFSLMVMFTAYIVIILNFSDFIPCSCGGVLEKLGWTEHLIFNLVFVALAGIGIWILSNKVATMLSAPALLAISTISGIALVTGLFLLSEDIVHERNNFTRRYPHHPIKRISELDLKYNSYYIAGVWKDKIYLGNSSAPLHMISIDTTLKDTLHIRLKLEPDNLTFRTVKTKVNPPYFYIMDGTVPCIYRGNIEDWTAKLWMYNNAYFSVGEPINSNVIAIRARSSRTKENVLGLIMVKDSPTVSLSDELLQRQIDGIFDTDGHLLWNTHLKQLIYLHSYRNEIIVADSNLKLIDRKRTIDTFAIAQIKVAKIPSKNLTKLASPPLKVNNNGTTYGNHLFVHSNVLGKLEPEKMWNSTSVVDVYNLQDDSYAFSFYVHDKNNKKIRDFKVFGQLLVVLQDHYITTYRLKLNYKRSNQRFP